MTNRKEGAPKKEAPPKKEKKERRPKTPRVPLTLEDALGRATVSVPDAARLFLGISPHTAYAAVKNGEIQTFKIGGKMVVPVAPLAEKVGLRSRIGAAA